MTEWDVETLEDFEGTFFEDGTGWKLVFQIHMGISLRAKITQHTIRTGNFATQVSGLVWTADYEIFGFKDLPTRLRDCYAAIESLLSSDENIRWTETSGRSPEWTIESMIADIGMGEFEPLLRPQDPRPFVWLIAALNRMNYPKLRRSLQLQNLSSSSGLLYRAPEDDEGIWTSLPKTSDELAWDNMGNDTSVDFSETVSLSYALIWTIFKSNAITTYLASVALNKLKYVSLIGKMSTGEVAFGSDGWFRHIKPKIKCLDYIYGFTVLQYDGPDWTVKIGSSEETNIGSTYGSGIIESTIDDLDFEGDKAISIELITARPADSPFVPIAFPGADGVIRLSVRQAWIYCDLPEVMGVGELTAPKPTISGTAEQEE